MINERSIVAGVLLLVPLALLVVGRAGEFTQLAAFSPMFFPNLVLWCWAGVAALSLTTELLAGRAAASASTGAGAGAAGSADGGTGDRPVVVQLALVIAAMAAFVFALGELGFLLSGIAFALFSLRVLGIRSWPLWAGFGIGVPLVLFTLFHHGLGLPLPTSPFSYLF